MHRSITQGVEFHISVPLYASPSKLSIIHSFAAATKLPTGSHNGLHALRDALQPVEGDANGEPSSEMAPARPLLRHGMLTLFPTHASSHSGVYRRGGRANVIAPCKAGLRLPSPG